MQIWNRAQPFNQPLKHSPCWECAEAKQAGFYIPVARHTKSMTFAAGSVLCHLCATSPERKQSCRTSCNSCPQGKATN